MDLMGHGLHYRREILICIVVGAVPIVGTNVLLVSMSETGKLVTKMIHLYLLKIVLITGIWGHSLKHFVLDETHYKLNFVDTVSLNAYGVFNFCDFKKQNGFLAADLTSSKLFWFSIEGEVIREFDLQDPVIDIPLIYGAKFGDSNKLFILGRNKVVELDGKNGEFLRTIYFQDCVGSVFNIPSKLETTGNTLIHYGFYNTEIANTNFREFFEDLLMIRKYDLKTGVASSPPMIGYEDETVYRSKPKSYPHSFPVFAVGNSSIFLAMPYGGDIYQYNLERLVRTNHLKLPLSPRYNFQKVEGLAFQDDNPDKLYRAELLNSQIEAVEYSDSLNFLYVQVSKGLSESTLIPNRQYNYENILKREKTLLVFKDSDLVASMPLDASLFRMFDADGLNIYFTTMEEDSKIVIAQIEALPD